MAQLYDDRQTSILVSIIRKWSRRSRQLIVACPFRLFFQFLSVTELIERRGGIERRRSPFCPLFCWSASARLHHNKMAAQGLSARALESISDSPVFFFFFLPPPLCSCHTRRSECEKEGASHWRRVADCTLNAQLLRNKIRLSHSFFF